MKRAGMAAVALLLGLMPVGCVTRRVLITSEPTGAIVYHNGQPLGPTPVEMPFIYYGKYRFRLVRDGCATTDFDADLVAPWYEQPGVDFFSENVVPWPFRDKQVLHFKLEAVVPVPPDVIRTRAGQLQEQAKGIQRPADAAPLVPKPPRSAPLAPAVPPPTLPPISSAPSPGSP